MRWKTFIILCGKYIQDYKYKILSELPWFCRRCDTNIWCVFGFAVPAAVHLQNSNAKFHKVVSQHYSGKRLNYCIANLVRTVCTKFHSSQCICARRPYHAAEWTERGWHDSSTITVPPAWDTSSVAVSHQRHIVSVELVLTDNIIIIIIRHTTLITLLDYCATIYTTSVVLVFVFI